MKLIDIKSASLTIWFMGWLMVIAGVAYLGLRTIVAGVIAAFIGLVSTAMPWGGNDEGSA